MEDIQDVMSEAPGGDNHGFAIASYTDGEDTPHRSRRDLTMRLARLEQATGQAGFGLVSGRDDGGLVAHRGVLHHDEYVDTLALREAVLAELGLTHSELIEAYKMGRPTAEQRESREKIDSQLLALSRAGTNLSWLAEALELSEKTIDRAIRRAEAVEVVPVVRNPAVVTAKVCFVCTEPTARPRKRKSPDTPAHLRGTVALCDDDYARGFERRKGNPAYWRFRERLGTPRGAYA